MLRRGASERRRPVSSAARLEKHERGGGERGEADGGRPVLVEGHATKRGRIVSSRELQRYLVLLDSRVLLEYKSHARFRANGGASKAVPLGGYAVTATADPEAGGRVRLRLRHPDEARELVYWVPRAEAGVWRRELRLAAAGPPASAAAFSFVCVCGSGTLGPATLARLRNGTSGELFVLKRVPAGVASPAAVRGWLRLVHPHLARARFALPAGGGATTLAVDFHRCGSAFDALQRQPRRRMEEETVRVWAAQAVSALQYLHRRDTTHGNLKSENLLVTRGGASVALADHSLAAAARGTPQKYYAAPETLGERAPPAGPAADMWSLGCVMFELLTGSPPFRSRSRARTFAMATHGAAAFPPREEGRLSEEARDLVLALLSPDPADRPVGAQLRGDPFFRGISWSAVAAGTLAAPFHTGRLQLGRIKPTPSAQNLLKATPQRDDDVGGGGGDDGGGGGDGRGDTPPPRTPPSPRRSVSDVGLSSRDGEDCPGEATAASPRQLPSRPLRPPPPPPLAALPPRAPAGPLQPSAPRRPSLKLTPAGRGGSGHVLHQRTARKSLLAAATRNAARAARRASSPPDGAGVAAAAAAASAASKRSRSARRRGSN